MKYFSMDSIHFHKKNGEDPVLMIEKRWINPFFAVTHGTIQTQGLSMGQLDLIRTKKKI